MTVDVVIYLLGMPPAALAAGLVATRSNRGKPVKDQQPVGLDAIAVAVLWPAAVALLGLFALVEVIEHVSERIDGRLPPPRRELLAETERLRGLHAELGFDDDDQDVMLPIREVG